VIKYQQIVLPVLFLWSFQEIPALAVILPVSNATQQTFPNVKHASLLTLCTQIAVNNVSCVIFNPVRFAMKQISANASNARKDFI